MEPATRRAAWAAIATAAWSRRTFASPPGNRALRALSSPGTRPTSANIGSRRSGISATPRARRDNGATGMRRNGAGPSRSPMKRSRVGTNSRARPSTFRDALYHSTLPHARCLTQPPPISASSSRRRRCGSRTAPSTDGRDVTPTLEAAKGAAPTSGTTSRRCPSCSPRSSARCARRTIPTTWIRTGASASASACRSARRTRPSALAPTDNSAASSSSIATGSSAATRTGCGASGRG